MARLTKEELEIVKQHYCVNELWSWSKLSTYMTSPFEYYLKYIAHAKEDRTDCVYAPMGTICHSTIEDFYSGKISHEKMLSQFEDGWITAIDIIDLKFDRNDEHKNKSIKSKYKENLVHFFKNHQKIPYKVILEQFMTAKVGNHVFQGYIDAYYKDEEENHYIIDWKTSTEYKGKDLDEKSGQLIVYAIGLHQRGIPYEKMKLGWNFLKYVTVTVSQKNGKTKERHIERRELGEALQSNAKVWLKEFGYANKIDDYLKQMLDTNGIDCLPEEVKAKYKITDCYVFLNDVEALVKKWETIIIDTIEDIKLREADYHETKNNKCFWDTDENIKSQSFYFATLSGYSPNLHLPYKAYLEKLEAATNGEDTFSGVGNTEETVRVSVKITNDITKPNKNNSIIDNVDLSWLDML